MSRSKAKRKPAGGRLQTFGIFATLVVVAVLIGSFAAQYLNPRPRAAAPAPAADSPAVAAAADAVPAGRVRVQVLNASGRPGLAREATRVLRDRGFDVKEFGNGQGFPPDSSVVLDRVGRMEVARQVADAVGIRRVTARPDSNLYLDATVVLGRDWRAPKDP
jgi:hypothetical protein